MVDEGVRALCMGIAYEALKNYRTLSKLEQQGRIVLATPTTTKFRKKHGVGYGYVPFTFDEIETFFLDNGELYTGIRTEHIMETLHKIRVGEIE